MVKETKEHQDAEGRMGEEPRAPRTNPETTEISDPEKSGFDLDPSDSKAHDFPNVTTDGTHEEPMKQKPKHMVDALQRKVNGLEKNVNNLETKMDQMMALINKMYAEQISPSPTADIQSKSKEATTHASENSNPVTTVKESTDDAKLKSEDATTSAPEDSTTVTTVKESVADVKSKSKDTTAKRPWRFYHHRNCQRTSY